MIPKPKHLGPEFGAQFKDESVVKAYRYRPPYPDELFDILANLIYSEQRTVLDIGCGDGNLARYLMHRVDRIDAVDISKAMIEQGKNLPGGDHPNLNWIHGPLEKVSLSPRYALVTAGHSLHWMAWDVVFPKIQACLASEGFLAIVSNKPSANPWDADLGDLIQQFSTNRDYHPYDIVAELQQRELFEVIGGKNTTPMPFIQTVDDYIESWHSRNGLSRERLSSEAAEAFDNHVRALVFNYNSSDTIEMLFTGHVVWGLPKNPFGNNGV
jgi:predicted TPR repeat methyltransferase